MDILHSLQFVKGAVSTKDFVPALTHYHIKNNLIKSFNGSLSLCCPINLDIEATPKAVPFFKAIQTCKTTTAIHLTSSGRLGIKSGKFKAFIPCTTEVFPEVLPSGERIALDGKFIPALKQLQPFIAEDASRPWARGILFRGQSAFATNNICLVENWLGYDMPTEINIPQSAVKELIRIGEEPESIQMDERSATFYFSGDRWLRTNLLATAWPDISQLLNTQANPISLPEDFFPAIQELSPFVDELNRIFLTENKVATSLCDGEGASIDLDLKVKEGCFNNKQLLAISQIVKQIDFTKYPKPCPFFGDNIRGVITGIKL